MAHSGSGSFLANMAQQRKFLRSMRTELLDRPGIARQGGPPPGVVPADRPNPQRTAIKTADSPLLGEPAPQEDRLVMAQQFMDSMVAKREQDARLTGRIIPPKGSRDELIRNVKQYYRVFLPISVNRFGR